VIAHPAPVKKPTQTQTQIGMGGWHVEFTPLVMPSSDQRRFALRKNSKLVADQHPKLTTQMLTVWC
jgi:hypothetical protein